MLVAPARTRLILRSLGLVVSALMGLAANAQLTPARVYNGVSRPFPVVVEAPKGARDVRIELLEPVTARVVGSAAVEPGLVDLAAHFPILWSASTPRLLYAQLVVTGEASDPQAIGPALVLQPMIEPKPAMLLNPATNAPWFLDPRTGRPSFEARDGVITFGPAEEAAYTGIRAYVDQHIIVQTSHGSITLFLRPDAAPNTVWNFIELARGGFYTDIPIHRIVPVRADGTPFVIQFGDPTGTGNGGPGYTIDLEPSSLLHDLGVMSMARASDPNTAGSQVFICLSRDGTKHLDGRYTAFAQTYTGLETIRAIASEPIDAESRPLKPVTVERITLVDATPYTSTPKPVSSPAEPGRDR